MRAFLLLCAAVKRVISKNKNLIWRQKEFHLLIHCDAPKQYRARQTLFCLFHSFWEKIAFVRTFFFVLLKKRDRDPLNRPSVVNSLAKQRTKVKCWTAVVATGAQCSSEKIFAAANKKHPTLASVCAYSFGRRPDVKAPVSTVSVVAFFRCASV